MKKLIIVISFLFSILTQSQNLRVINIERDKEHSSFFNEEYVKSVDSAYVIVNAVFNSKEFQNLFNEQTRFPYWNYCKPNKCKASKNYKGEEVINGNQAFEKIFKKQNVLWTIYFEEKSNSALGSTCPNTNYTTAYFENIKEDMPNLPLSYAIAVNLCHEYMHQIGFCHYSNSFKQPNNEQPDPNGFKNDIAYRVGWESYFILKKWHQDGFKINNL